MRAVLDNCVPRTLLRRLRGLAGVDATTVGHLGWADADDGPLLDYLSAPGVCDAFVTIDGNLEHQQRLDVRPFGTVVLSARSNRLAELLPLTHFLRIIRGILLKGSGLAEIAPELWPLLLFLTLAMAIGVKRYRQTVD